MRISMESRKKMFVENVKVHKPKDKKSLYKLAEKYGFSSTEVDKMRLN